MVRVFLCLTQHHALHAVARGEASFVFTAERCSAVCVHLCVCTCVSAPVCVHVCADGRRAAPAAQRLPGALQ